jgi:hypothetical protein
VDRRRRLTIGAAVAVTAGITTAVWVATTDHPRSVALPPAGEVEAAFVEGHPVFVVHRGAGEVLVLDAVSPHDPVPKVLAFCRTSCLFEDLWHGSTFLADGAWLGGPAPTGSLAEVDPSVVDDLVVDDLVVHDPAGVAGAADLWYPTPAVVVGDEVSAG